MNLRIIFSCFIMLTCLSFSSWANRKMVEQYISQFKDIATTEMKRTGVPASIKLAQGLLESSWGQSDLALVANNHFGIKCGGNWEGKMYFKVDDDVDASGRLIESCFRSFLSAQESYIAHSEFLTNPAKKARYGFLFEYPSTDYVSWAKGLQFSGYATDKKYADKLISLIESYQLYQYDILIDKNQLPVDIYADKQKSETTLFATEETITRQNYDLESNNSIDKEIKKTKSGRRVVNGLSCVLATEGETIETISKRHRTNKHDVVIYNESKYYLDTPLEEGEIVYLEPKKRFNEGYTWHIVKESESLFDVAQKYGIKVSSLASRNKIPEHARLTKGLKLYINQPGMDHSHLKEVLVTEEFIDFGALK
ncbi:MAG: glucosaminidase domain-containing protein [Saprospiraceae bacterium]